MKKIISSIAAISLVALSVAFGPADASAVAVTFTDGNATGNATYAVSANADFGIEYASSAAYDAADTITLSLYDSNGSLYAQSFQDYTVGADTDPDTANATNTDADGSFSFATPGKAIFTLGATNDGTAIKLEAKFPATFASGVYSLSVISSDGDFSVISLYVGSANQVSVTANIEPTLSFSLGANSLALGTLTPGTPSTAASTVTAATNAAAGLTVNVRNTANGLNDGSGNSIDAVPADTSKTTIEANKATTEYYGFRAYDAGSLASATFVDGTSANPYASAAVTVEFEPMASGADLAVMSTNAPVASTAVAYEILANANSTSAAGNYTDTLTFTVVPSF